MDGTPLNASDIAYYEIYYTVASTGAIEVIKVTDKAAISHRISNLPAGTYHFSMVVADNAGMTSSMSEAIEVELR